MSAASPQRILVLPGSARQGSFNRALAGVAAARLADAGAQATVVDWAALDLPLYHGDLESAGLPAGALELRSLVATHEALLFVTPEYNGFPPPLLVNALDWLSRVPAAEAQPAGLAALAGKPAALLSASPGPLGGLRSLMFLRQFLQLSLGLLVLPEQFALGQAGQAFTAEGGLADAKQAAGVQRVLDALRQMATRLRPA